MHIKYIFSSILFRLDLFFNYLKLFFYLKVLKLNSYQENYYFKSSNTKNIRDCNSRLKAIKQNINLNFNILDLGCNNGFFLFKLLHPNSIGLGIDNDRNSIIIAKATANLKNIQNISFLNIDINIEHINNIPNFNTVIFMSVFHHLVYNLGKDTAIKILEIICKKTDKNLIFDTGHINEGNFKWTDSIYFIGEDYEKWFRSFFLQNGFKNFTVIGQFPTNISKNKRKLFLLSK